MTGIGIGKEIWNNIHDQFDVFVGQVNKCVHLFCDL